ncbi:hypothetical protein [Bacillus cereus group sp. BfR-BA-01383]|nr:hypothetical protein [Bacillus cereus group sp. BfR-BA-01383]
MKPPTILAAEAGLSKKWKRLVQNRRALELSRLKRFLLQTRELNALSILP